MTVHYHGTPITPNAVLDTLAGRSFCISYARPRQVARCHAIGEGVMLDNGAFRFWQRGEKMGDKWWRAYYDWCEEWLTYRTTWAVIPDVIDGGVADNDRLLKQWPFKDRGAPVWHMHEPLRRLMRLAIDWPRVCIGSSGSFAVVGDMKWHIRMHQAMNVLCSPGESPPVDLHMLRGLALVKKGAPYPFSSVDSSSVARNHPRDKGSAADQVARWDARQCPPVWEPVL